MKNMKTSFLWKPWWMLTGVGPWRCLPCPGWVCFLVLMEKLSLQGDFWLRLLEPEKGHQVSCLLYNVGPSLKEWKLPVCPPVLSEPWRLWYSLPGSSVLRILQAWILEWVAIFSSRGIFPPQRLNPHLLHWQARLLSLAPSGNLAEKCDLKKTERDLAWLA